MDEIARRSGVTPPVLYDHFDSKLDLHRRLLERTRDELLAMWRAELAGDEPIEGGVGGVARGAGGGRADRGARAPRAGGLGALRRGASLCRADVLPGSERR